MGHALAAEDGGDQPLHSYVIDSIEDAINAVLGNDNRAPKPSEPVPYIYQGDTVFLDTYIDISGVLPPYPQLAYWDGYDMYDEPPKYNITIGDGKKPYYRFYVDPAIFTTRTGRWYKWGGEYEKQGNNLAFVVSPIHFENYTMRFPNGTLLDLTVQVNPVEYIEHPKPFEPLLPERHVADYVIAKGDPLIWDDGGYRLWLFGRRDGVYANPDGNVSAETIGRMESGTYTVGIQVAGNNTIYEAQVANNTLIPGLYGRKPVDIFGKDPLTVLSNVRGMLEGTDDSLFEYTLELADPYITIRQADETLLNNTSYMDVRGYTNAMNGTEITVTLDEKDRKEFVGYGVAWRTSPGNLSYYRAYVPLDYDELAADARNHTLIARTAIGGKVEKDFKISLMPPDSYRPPAALKYVEDRNPFVPTPTPEVITQVVTKEVPIYVTVEVTPPPSMVYAQQKAAVDAKWAETFELVKLAGLCVAAVVIGLLIARYLVSVRWRKIQIDEASRRNGR